ncbi:hypothetical protein SESBI_21946 [Sesbania bispinosa]|nr:hypothetical protein SESBI_21946 [Sesbania bispinosa]
MSGLVDLWTNESSKLREKERTAAAAASTSTHHQQQKDNTTTSTALASAIAKHMQFYKPRLLLSEASLSMLVECFNP